MSVEAAARGAGRKSDMTRQRLLDAANRLFRAHGYAATTAAAIADDAGVTERTFYRYFPAKADLLHASWERRREVLRRVLVTSDAPDLFDVVRDAMHEFSEHVRISVDSGVETVVPLLADRDAASAVLEVLLRVEQDLATQLALRAGRTSEDFSVRTAAYATVGVFRAALRAFADPAAGGRSITAFVDEGMERLRPLFAGLAA
jgi:AcrR family transcriptional regulator